MKAGQKKGMTLFDNKTAMLLKGISYFIDPHCRTQFINVEILVDKSLIQIIDSISCFRAYSTSTVKPLLSL